MNIIQVRLFIKTPTENNALNAVKQISTIIEKNANLESKTIQKYWKIPEYYEVFLKYTPLHNPDEDYRNILKLLATGWEIINPAESIWNPEDKNKFVINDVMWAQLECISDS